MEGAVDQPSANAITTIIVINGRERESGAARTIRLTLGRLMWWINYIFKNPVYQRKSPGVTERSFADKVLQVVQVTLTGFEPVSRP